MIVFGGTQRCGTSVLAEVLYECGIDLGTDHWDERVAGGFESPHICAGVQKELSTKSDDWGPFPYEDAWDVMEKPRGFRLRTTFRNLPVMKFSFLLMHPDITEAFCEWAKRDLDDVRFVLIHRPAVGVVKSKRATRQRRQQFARDHTLLQHGAHDLAFNRMRAFNHLRSKVSEDHIRHLKYPDVLRNQDLFIDALRSFGFHSVREDVWAKAWAKTVDPDKVTERV